MIQYTPMEELDRQIAMMPPDPDDERHRLSNPDRHRLKVTLPKDRICAMRREGRRPVDIARELGLLPVSVRRVLSSHGLTWMKHKETACG